MNWKVFITASVSGLLLAFPQNIFSCGPTEDPYDYYTSFFSNQAGTSEALKPFYYTALLEFYDDDWYWNEEDRQPASVSHNVANEWAAYAKSSNINDAIQLVYQADIKTKAAILAAIRDGKSLPDSLSRNTIIQHFVKGKNAEAASYLLFATKTEGVSAPSGWEDKKTDSLQLNEYILQAQKAYDESTDPFIRNKYAFQLCKLAFYNNRHEDCIRWYDAYFKEGNTSAVNELALSYKGGSLYRLGRKKEAAYAFSKAFPLSNQNRKTNFLGFLWSTDNCNAELMPAYTALARNNGEKANMIAMFAMHGTDYRLENMKQVYGLDPASPLLPLLVTREINKLEEQYFTPLLAKEPGGSTRYVSWAEWRYSQDTTTSTDGKTQAVNTAKFLEQLMNDKSLPNRGLYAAGAAYLHYMNRDFEGAKSLLAKAKDLQQDARIKDQVQLINLLIAANEGGAITKERETQLLPAMQWLVQKAKGDKEYGIFCRNFFSEILAQKYEQQQDVPRAALAYALADLAFRPEEENAYGYFYSSARDFVQENMTTENLVNLYEVMTKPVTETEKFFVQHSSVKKDHVVDVLGTSYLRDRNYPKAIEWLSKAGKLEPLTVDYYNYNSGNSKMVNVDPFYDYLNDWQRYDKGLQVPYNKLTLARKLQEMKTQIDSGKIPGDRSRLLYEYASALYNMSYYGNTWGAVAYYRSSSDWNMGSYKLPWQKEYYGVHEARNYYQKAYEAATNKEFKAACLFMVAKCVQRQVPKPPYDYNNYEQYEKAEAAFQKKFMNNPYFAQFKKEFGNTKFYQYTYNRCSYLRDYVKKSATAGPKGKG